MKEEENSKVFLYFSALLLIVVTITILGINYKNKSNYKPTPTLTELHKEYVKSVIHTSSLRYDYRHGMEEVHSKLLEASTSCLSVVNTYNTRVSILHRDSLIDSQLPVALNRVMCEVQ